MGIGLSYRKKQVGIEKQKEKDWKTKDIECIRKQITDRWTVKRDGKRETI